jgi:hypothetical protein
MFEATLSIDLGASYTKVAYRDACIPSQTGTLPKESRVLLFDDSPLIPSLAIRTDDSANPWIFGRVAAQTKPGARMRVFQNWKADLFRPKNDKDSATAAIIAHKFFEWLRGKLMDSGIDVRKCQTRVAMPAFNTFEDNAHLLARCMDLSGWDDPTLILKVREPHANTLGLFAGVRNLVMRNATGELNPDYGRMFGHDNVYIQAARGHVLHGNQANLVTVLVVDIGAFTTDLALLIFDVNAPADGMCHIQQESYELGVINQLDRPLFAALGQQHGFAWSQLTFEGAELCKQDLYRGEPHLLQLTVESPIIELGNSEDKSKVEGATTRFAAEAWRKIQAFLAGTTPSRTYLTGGGGLIKPLAEKLRALCEGNNIQFGVINDDDHLAGTTKSLRRLATCVGGASVILQQAGRQEPHALPPQPQAPASFERMITYRDCRCRGGHKDCCFCHGSGWVVSNT